MILDQTKLPGQVEYVELRTKEDVYQAIRRLQVRGAPAIGICAAFGMYVLSLAMPQGNYQDFVREFSRVKDYIGSSRPTAVNLGWALPETKCYNPAFDVTDHSLITAIVTDQGIFREPYIETLARA